MPTRRVFCCFRQAAPVLAVLTFHMAVCTGLHCNPVQVVPDADLRRGALGDLMPEPFTGAAADQGVAVRALEIRPGMVVVRRGVQGAGILGIAGGMTVQTVFRANHAADEAAFHPALRGKDPAVLPLIAHNGPFGNIPGSLRKWRVIGVGLGAVVRENGPLNLPQTGTGGGCPPVIAAVDLLISLMKAVPRQVTHQAVRLQNAAFPEMAFPVGREAGAEVAIVRRFIARFRLDQVHGQVGPAIGFSAVLQRAAPGMAPSTGRRLDFVLPVQLCTADPVVGGKIDFFWIPVDFAGQPSRRREGRPFAVHAR